MKTKWLALCFVLSPIAHADWTEDSVVYDVSSKDAMEMAEALGNFPQAVEWLTVHSLTGASRLKVTQVIGRVAMYRWENDANCTVPNPGDVAKIKLYNATTDYLYEADPTVMWQLLTTVSEVDPCNRGPIPLTANVTRKK